MESIFEKDKMYMSDEESFVVSEFDIMDETLQYTLDFNTKREPSIFSNVYDQKHPKDSWTISIDENNLFYSALMQFLGEEETVTFHDEFLPGRYVNISLEDNNINLRFNCPYDQTGVVNIRISEKDPNRERFMNLISSLDTVFKTYVRPRAK